ncbi:MAG: sialidase family protein [Anaerolineales bacterium]
MGKRIRSLQIVAALLIVATAGVLTASAASFKAGNLVQVTGGSPFANCTADNVAGQSGTVFHNSEVEPWVDVNPTNPKNVVGSVQQDRWSNGGARGLVAGVSFNGGKTWQTVVIPKITVCSGGTVVNGGDFKRATDPWLSFSPNGHLYQFSLVLDIETPPGSEGGFGKNAMLVSKSTDGGLTWSDPITVIRDENPRFLNDKNSITADPTNSNFVYAVWDRLDVPPGAVMNPENVFGLGFKGPVYFARTTNGGQSWEPARQIYNPGGNNQTIGNQIVVRPDGTVINFFNEILNFRNDDGGFQFDFNLAFIRSTDKGATWPPGPAIRAAKMQPRTLFAPPPEFLGVYDPETNPLTGDPVRTEDAIPEVAVDPNNGNLYAVWQDSRFSNNGNFSNPNLLIDEIAFSQSTDGGFTWSTPIKINKTPTGIALGNRQAFLPSVDVGADGTIAVTYYDFRNNDSGVDLKTDYFVIHCHPSAGCTNSANWGNEIRLTTTSFNMRQAPFARGFFVGDYEGLASDGNNFVAFFSQPHGSDPSSVFFRRVGR